jgi:parallel beta-helix repeat protein
MRHRLLLASLFMLVASLLLLVLCLPLFAWSATYSVATDGDDGAGCGGTMRTIGRGLQCLGPGDTLLISSGDYPEQLHGLLGTRWPSGTADAPITIGAAPGATVVINPSGSGDFFDLVYLEQTQYLVFDHLTWDASNVQVTQGGQIFRLGDGAANIRVQQSVLKNHATGNGVLTGDGAVTFSGNEIYGNRGYGLYVTGPGNVIEGNVIHDNAGYGVHVYRSGARSVSDNLVRGNRLVHNGYDNANPAGSCAILLSSGERNLACSNIIEGHNGCGVQVYGNASDAGVFGNQVRETTGACIDINPGADGTRLGDNTCTNTAQEVSDNGTSTVFGASRPAGCDGGQGVPEPPQNLRVVSAPAASEPAPETAPAPEPVPESPPAAEATPAPDIAPSPEPAPAPTLESAPAPTLESAPAPDPVPSTGRRGRRFWRFGRP